MFVPLAVFVALAQPAIDPPNAVVELQRNGVRVGVGISVSGAWGFAAPGMHGSEPMTVSFYSAGNRDLLSMVAKSLMGTDVPATWTVTRWPRGPRQSTSRTMSFAWASAVDLPGFEQGDIRLRPVRVGFSFSGITEPLAGGGNMPAASNEPLGTCSLEVEGFAGQALASEPIRLSVVSADLDGDGIDDRRPTFSPIVFYVSYAEAAPYYEAYNAALFGRGGNVTVKYTLSDSTADPCTIDATFRGGVRSVSLDDPLEIAGSQSKVRVEVVPTTSPTTGELELIIK